MYEPIVGASESYAGYEPASTPARTMQRTSKLQVAYDELKIDLLEEVHLVDARIIKPAMEAKDWIQPLKKVIKKREDKKVSLRRSIVKLQQANRFPVGLRKVPGPG